MGENQTINFNSLFSTSKIFKKIRKAAGILSNVFTLEKESEIPSGSFCAGKVRLLALDLMKCKQKNIMRTQSQGLKLTKLL